MIDTEFKFGEVHELAKQIECGEDRVHFQNIFSNANGGVVLVGFKAGQKLDTHTAPAEVMVNVIEGEIEFTMLGKPHILKAGEFLLMGADVQHSVKANADSKLMLIKVKP
ncbi:MAG: cupin domain-containing protein [Muribaculaceae bacterium]|nr:cupin domain-containing protein [Muribaculaceae bacterium]MDE6791476.1 cupin domain-containing protein [Muribaculaceae bacterium]